MMAIGLLTLYFQIPGCTSLKEKRSRVKPLLCRLQRKFNISIAEIEKQDAWQESVISCVMISNDKNYTYQALQQVVHYISQNFPDLYILDEVIEMI